MIGRLVRGLIVVCLGVIIAIYGARCSELNAGYAAALLFISVVLELMISFTFDTAGGVVWTLIGCEVLKIIFGGVYWWVTSQQRVIATADLGLSEGFAWAAFVAAVIVTLLTALFAIVLWSQSPGPRPSLIFVLFCTLAAFLHVTYFMTFSIALHNKARMGKGLSSTTSAALDSGESDGSPPAPAPAVDSLAIRKFFFREWGADLRCTQSLRTQAERSGIQDDIMKADLDGRQTLLEKFDSSECKDEVDRANAAWNIGEIFNLKTQFEQLLTTHQYIVCEVEIAGHANEKAPKGARWTNNYELSNNRAQTIALLLNELKREVAIEPPPQEPDQPHPGFKKVPPIPIESAKLILHSTPVPKADVDDYFEQEGWKWARRLDKHLSAEIRMFAVRDNPTEEARRRSVPHALTLLDYLYFVIYTLTTTGYGDIVPIDGATKFMTSIANLSEFFFIVIIINSLVASRPDESPKPAAPKV
jgi:Ion channel